MIFFCGKYTKRFHSEPAKHHHINKPALSPQRKLRGKVASNKMEMKPTEPETSEQIDENMNINPSTHEVRSVEVKLECEEFIVKDVKPST